MNPTASVDEPSKAHAGLADALASVVTFLVALPLCIGISVACGVPAERGLVTGIIGGIIVGLLAGAPLLVSGPAASLIVPVFDVVQSHGIGVLGPIVILSGVWQMLAGVLRLGQWFRAVAPAVIHGMLIGIGILILASQLHVSIGGDPRGTFLQNLGAFPGALVGAVRDGHAGSVLAGASTIGILVAWNRWRPRALGLVPGHLVSLLVVTGVVLAFRIPVRFLDVSPRFFDALSVVSIADLSLLRDPGLIGLSLMFAFVASAATLLTAAAIDQRQTHSPTDYNREMFAQGVGNSLAGAIGGLPMTGVIVRSSVNVDAGARTRLSTILHGVWILAFVTVAPEVLERIPRAALGAILVYTGYRLIDVRALGELDRRGRGELVIALLTLFGVVFVELFLGIVLGLGAAILKLVYTFSRLEIRSVPGAAQTAHHLHLVGSATFLQVPRLAEALDRVPKDWELRLHIDDLEHIDHACLELLSNWERKRGGDGPARLVVEWDELTNRYQRARFGSQQRDLNEPSTSLLRVLWGEWKRVYRERLQAEEDSVLGADWLAVDRIRLRLDASQLDDVLVAAADMLAPVAGSSAAVVLERLRAQCAEGQVTLGRGVSLPHATLENIERPFAAVVTTKTPLELSGDAADVFFVLLAPEANPKRHLLSLAQVGRLCQRPDALEGLRSADTEAAAAAVLRQVDEALSAGQAPPSASDHGTVRVAVLELDSQLDREKVLVDLMEEAFGPTVVLGADHDEALWAILGRLLSAPANRRLLVVSVEQRDVALLTQLLDEFSRLVAPGLVKIHLLRRDSLALDATQPPAAGSSKAYIGK